MRIPKWLAVALCTVVLAGCVPSLLVGNQLQSRLMWAFLTPLVGFNPNEINFFEAPIIKDRMTALLGDKYDPVMKLLRTANEIQHEGALYYVVSRYAPPEAQAIVDTAGLVWNADTNQMAVMLIDDGAPEIFAEQATTAAVNALVPKLPVELQTAYDKALMVKNSVDATKAQIEQATQLPEAAEDPLLELIRQKTGNQ